MRKTTLCLFLLFTVICVAQREKVKIDGLNYELFMERNMACVTYEVRDANNLYSSPYIGDIEVPEEVVWHKKTYRVKAINKGAFANCTSLHSVKLPNSIIKIDEIAFGNCKSLASITIPPSVTTIGNAAFFGCLDMREVVFEKDVTPHRLQLGDNVFYGCKALERVKFNGILNLEIPQQAFAGCGNLVSVESDEAIMSIGEKAFMNCTKLKDIDLERVGNISLYAFLGCNSLSKENMAIYTAHNDATVKALQEKETQKTGGAQNENKQTVVRPLPSRYPEFKSNAEVWIDSIYYEVDSQNEQARVADGRHAIKAGKVVIPSEILYKDKTYLVRMIGKEAFRDAEDLKSIRMPDSLEYIGESAFEGCRKLEEVALSEKASKLFIRPRAFYGCASLLTIDFPHTPGKDSRLSVRIDSLAFANCTSLAAIDLHDEVFEVGNRTFENCTSLWDIRIGKGTVFFGKNVFFGCKALTEEQRQAIMERIKAIRRDEKSPEFPGDVYQWLNQHVSYPKECIEKNIQGRAHVQIVIDTDGSVGDIKVLRSPDPAISAEAIRLAKSMPKWKPATQGNKAVRMRYVLPVMFRLGTGK